MVRKFMNNKGQAYSTFQLLIAAVIAMAILVILIPIIMQVMGIITSDPTDETKRMLSNAVDNPSALQYTPEVAFEPGDVLAAQAITERTGIAKDQVCMGALDFGDEGEDDDFEVLKDDAAHRILYHGTGTKTVKIAIVCNVSLEDLEDDIAAYGLDDKITLDDCPETCQEGGTCCAVILKRT
ncbi:MAG: hypothetical protein V1672_03360 [Candidatus Diapherotrites archaeon]